jgi:hypothetical protein
VKPFVSIFFHGPGTCADGQEFDDYDWRTVSVESDAHGGHWKTWLLSLYSDWDLELKGLSLLLLSPEGLISSIFKAPKNYPSSHSNLKISLINPIDRQWWK